MNTLANRLNRNVRVGVLAGIIAGNCLATDGPIPDPPSKQLSGHTSATGNGTPATTANANTLASILNLFGIIFGH